MTNPVMSNHAMTNQTMSNRTDIELLSQYRAGSHPAFAELVKRHVDWVYSAARRRVGDTHLAEDVTQAVFLALAGNWRLTEKTIVTSWLFGVVRYTSSNAIRDRMRRRRHEAAAASQREWHSVPQQWDDLSPLLEHAVDGLRGGDREAVLLRFYQRFTFTEVGQALGISEDGARKRVDRAVSKLHRYFTSRGVAVPAAVLTGGLFEHCVQTAPPALAATLSAGSSSEMGLNLFRMAARHLRHLFLMRMAAMMAVAAVAVIALVAYLHLANVVPELPASTAVAAISNPPQTIPATSPSTEPPTFATAITLDQIIAGVKKSETQFKNIHIKNFETTLEELQKGQAQWVETPKRFAGSAWYDANPKGRLRVYFSDYVMAWEQGPAPFADSIYDLSWDGKEGRELTLATGYSSKMNRMRSARRSADVPMLLKASIYDTGVGFTLQFMPTDQPLSAILETIRDKHIIKPEILSQKMNGFDTVRLGYRKTVADGSVCYWFDPSRGFSFVKRQIKMTFDGLQTTEDVDIFELKPVAPGIWFPVRASMVQDDISNPGSSVRYSYHTADVAVNDPQFDPAIISVPIPKGWMVYDNHTSANRRYVTMEDGSEQEIHTGSVMPHIRAGPSTRPDGESPPITLDPRAWW